MLIFLFDFDFYIIMTKLTLTQIWISSRWLEYGIYPAGIFIDSCAANSLFTSRHEIGRHAKSLSLPLLSE